MKNKILALFLILIIFVSMIPTNVFAVATDLTFVKQKIDEKEFSIHYFAPEEYPDVFILKSDTSYTLYYVQEEGQYKCNSNGYGKITTDCARIFNIKTLDDLYDILFLGKYDSYSFDVVKAGGNVQGTINQMYVSLSLDSLASVNTQSHIDQAIRSDYTTFKDFYKEWYFKQNGFYPQPDLEGSEYMQGKYYAILQQEIVKTSSGADIDTGLKSGGGYVETCDDVKIFSNDGAFIYVVISSETATGEFMEAFNFNFFDNLLQGLKNFFLSFVGQNQNAFISKAYKLMYADGEQGEERNNYVFSEHHLSVFYNTKEYLNRYYFSNLEDASKFVLYGTAGAKPEHIETGKTHYGYGYNQLMYNNYDIDGYDTNPIPTNQYPLSKTYITLRFHDENISEREYIRINFNYFPFASCLGDDNILRIHKKLKPEYFTAYYVYNDKLTEKENKLAEREFYRDFSNYEKTDKYDSSITQKFYIYCPELEKEFVSNSWEIVDAKHSTYKFKKTVDEDGNIIIGSGSLYEDDATIDIQKDSVTGETVIYDKQNNKYIITDTGEEKIWNEEKQGYFDDITGEQYDPSNLVSEMGEWRESLKKHLSSLENISNVIDSFTDIIDNASKQMEQLTSLFNAFFKNIPSPFRILITFVILSLIIMRITRRK